MKKSKEEHIKEFLANESESQNTKAEILAMIDSVDGSDNDLVKELHDIVMSVKPSLPS